MVLLSPECIYEILTFFHPRELLLCSQLNNDFNNLAYLDSLWKIQNGNAHKQLFNKQTYYETCKLYYQLNSLSKKFKMKYTLEKLYNLETVRLHSDRFGVLQYKNSIKSEYFDLVFSSSFYHFVDLDEIDSQLQKIPLGLELLPNLKNLHLENIYLENIPLGIELLTNLQLLSLRDAQLDKISGRIYQFPNLTHLDLSNNKITELPLGIGKLINLQKFWLNDNELTQLPSQIWQLTNLQLLCLNSNKLTQLSSEIGKLTNLRTLGLRYNELTQLPPEIGQLTNLILY